MICPTCSKPMPRYAIPPRRFYHRCFDHGLFAHISFFSQFPQTAHIPRDLQKAREQAHSSKDTPLKCPACRKAMKITRLGPDSPIEVDQCFRCNSVWFDVGELEKVENKGDLEQHFAKEELRSDYLGADVVYGKKPMSSPEAIKVSSFHVLNLLGLPVEEEATAMHKAPVMTFMMAIACFIFTVRALKSPEFMANYLFYPTDPFLNGGINFIVSTLMHGGWYHLLANLYFLFLVSDNIEDRDGPLFLFLLFWGAALGGDLLTIYLGLTNPSLGASGGIGGLIAYYAVMFPKNRLRMGILTLQLTWVSYSLSTMWFLIFWISLQMLGLFYQLAGFGNVGYAAHAGGAAIGLIVAFFRSESKTY